MNPKRIRLDPLSKAEICKSPSHNRGFSVFSQSWLEEGRQNGRQLALQKRAFR